MRIGWKMRWRCGLGNWWWANNRSGDLLRGPVRVFRVFVATKVGPLARSCACFPGVCCYKGWTSCEVLCVFSGCLLLHRLDLLRGPVRVFRVFVATKVGPLARSCACFPDVCCYKGWTSCEARFLYTRYSPLIC
jgi:hypothetical protein